MAKLTLKGETYDVRALTLFDLKSVGPAIDRINARSKMGAGGVAPTFADTVEIAADLLEVIAAGVDGQTGDSLAQMADAGDLQGLWSTYGDVVSEAGIGKRSGEAQPAAAPAKHSRSRSVSKT